MTLRTGPKISSWAIVGGVLDVGEDGRLDEPALVEVGGAPAAGGQRRPLGHTLGHVPEHPVALAARREGAHLRFRVELVPDLDLGERADERLGELVMTVLRHDDPGQRRAHLAGHHALGLRQPRRREAEVRVVQDDRGRLPAELEGAAGDPLAAKRGDPPPGSSRAGEGDLVDPRVADEELGDLPIGGEHVEDARRQTDLLGDLGHQVPLAGRFR